MVLLRVLVMKSSHRAHKIEFDLLSRNSVIIDAGMCIGDFTNYLRSHKNTKQCRIIGLEACKRNFDILKRGNFGNTDVHHVALVGNNAPDVITFYDYTNFKGRGSIFDRHSSDMYPNITSHETIKVKTVKINNLLNRFNIDKVDYLKMDIEGAEHEIFKTIDCGIAQKIDQISIEVHPIPKDRNIKPAMFLIKKLQDLGYNLELFPEIAEIYAVRKKIIKC